MTRRPEDDEIIRLCDEALELLRQTCGKHLNEDGTLWCGRKRGHAGSCHGVSVSSSFEVASEARPGR